MSRSNYQLVFFFNDTATTEIYTLSLHDALPIYCVGGAVRLAGMWTPNSPSRDTKWPDQPTPTVAAPAAYTFPDRKSTRLNSSHLVISYAVFCLKKKTVVLQ